MSIVYYCWFIIDDFWLNISESFDALVIWRDFSIEVSKKKNREIKTCGLVDRLAETEVLVLQER